MMVRRRWGELTCHHCGSSGILQVIEVLKSGLSLGARDGAGDNLGPKRFSVDEVFLILVGPAEETASTLGGKRAEKEGRYRAGGERRGVRGERQTREQSSLQMCAHGKTRCHCRNERVARASNGGAVRVERW